MALFTDLHIGDFYVNIILRDVARLNIVKIAKNAIMAINEINPDPDLNCSHNM